MSDGIRPEQINRKTEIFINDEFYHKQSDKWLREGDIVMVQSGHVGHTAVIPPELNNIAAHALIMFTDPKEEVSPYFLNFQFQTENIKTKLSEITTGNTIKHILSSEMKDFEMFFTDFEEQTAIGNTFQKLDSLINQHQQKHDKLSNIKKAMLEKMFPKQGETIPEIRFKGFSGEWEEKELGSVTQITMGQSPSGENYTNNSNDFILVQGNADLKNGFVVPRVWTSEVTKTATQGALIFSVRAPVGEVGKTNYDVVLGRGVAAINANEFIFQQLKKLKSDNYWHKVSAGSTFDAISSTELDSTLIWVSSDSEQTAIGNYFQKLDTLINQHQQQITKLNNIKQACLSKMFV
ncbi:restriction endonuclease subunit S [Shewanella baltica]|uniref:Restriction modification system DNA specificity domain n=1 Tax=Shewanella baltica (strain OS155 / ATCC BAA-1091) TaxID=325240 RepID=A3DB94_SHEB5|nr:restriction endonuclease subunit S [Shewanella baltica]ABN64007.1 restriction modification system DNA specificity domain [Shewanella baltica OS155]